MQKQFIRILVYTGDEAAIRTAIDTRKVQGTHQAEHYRIDEGVIGDMALTLADPALDPDLIKEVHDVLVSCIEHFNCQEIWQRPVIELAAKCQQLLRTVS